MKKKSLTLNLILTISIYAVFAQNKYPLDSILITEKYLGSYSIFDTLKIKNYTSSRKGTTYTFINDQPIDSTGLNAIMFFPILIRDRVYLNPHLPEDKNNEKFYYSVSDKKINSYSCCFQYDNGIQNFFTVEEFVKLYIVEPYSCRKTLLSDFYPLIETEYIKNTQYTLGDITNVNFIKPNIALVEICILGEFEGCKDVKYFLIKDKKIKNVTNLISVNYEKNKYQDYFSEIYFTNKKGYLRESLRLIGRKTKDDYIRNRLFDDNINYISDLLVLNRPVVMGVNIQKGELKNHFLRSFLNNGNEVIVPYKFIPILDLAMYKAYNNNLLTEEDLKELGKYELGILRNLIFAKYNYDFNSKFYQAYFNLYDFYYKMRSSRIKDINDKLTETDRKNINLIQSKEKSLGFSTK